MSPKADAVVLVSGGMDSLVCAALAKQKYKRVAFLHMSYGQRTAFKELECFNAIADFYQIPQNLRLILDVSFLKKIGASSLTDLSIDVSDYEEGQKEAPSSYVPFRNAHILSAAVSWAETLGAERIFIGANYEDSPGYPDCRPEYYEAFNRLIQVGSNLKNAKIETPVLRDTKKEIVEKALALKAPLELTWSCYKNEKLACAKCDSCALRLKGFKAAGAIDPISYQ